VILVNQNLQVFANAHIEAQIDSLFNIHNGWHWRPKKSVEFLFSLFQNFVVGFLFVLKIKDIIHFWAFSQTFNLYVLSRI
jgi:hypothetical protein